MPTDADQTETQDTDAPAVEGSDAVEGSEAVEASDAVEAPAAAPEAPLRRSRSLPSRRSRTSRAVPSPTPSAPLARSRVMKAKDALARSVGMKGDHVVPPAPR